MSQGEENTDQTASLDAVFDKETSETPDLEEDVAKLDSHKRAASEEVEKKPKNKKLKRSKGQAEESIDVGENDQEPIEEDEQTRKRREFEERFAAVLKKPTKRKKNDEVDLEAMQDEAIAHLKNMMKDAAELDIDCVNNKKPATHKLKLLPQVKDTLLKSNLYDSILDNNLLEAVRIWLEPLPDASLPAFEIQKTLFSELTKLPIKTIHLRESGLGKIILFYQKSKKVDPSLKRTAEKLIGDWTRPIMGRSDNYRAKKVQTAVIDADRLVNSPGIKTKPIRKSLYQESADRRKRAAAPEARTSVYTVAPQVNLNSMSQQKSSIAAMGVGSSLSRDERFKKLNQRLTQMSQKKKSTKKGGVSIEGRGLAM
ncbi:hypothetical protein OGAPHI_004421 [Ogataea philodendri]|uniref:TFIIS N-terminal domain-containing protein n=1 Tax=Ogataea philodendri TaxID=1378263 RepID=A0A9P8P6K5_9ASCO|nr:uncharacterized protein OGAPHI_004421 [Ogataea philodendri]KAH3666232.1 hypothetical protein OGAPHI_004421 [Ogataea philodendri]